MTQRGYIDSPAICLKTVPRFCNLREHHFPPTSTCTAARHDTRDTLRCESYRYELSWLINNCPITPQDNTPSGELRNTLLSTTQKSGAQTTETVRALETSRRDFAILTNCWRCIARLRSLSLRCRQIGSEIRPGGCDALSVEVFTLNIPGLK